MSDNIIYNTIGKTYDLTRKADPEIVRELLQLLRFTASGKYIDIGCGSGNYTAALEKKGLNIEGIDISDEMLEKARSKFPMIKFSRENAKKLSFQNAIFDGATCILATHHINDNTKLFQEVFRILKEGRFVIFTHTPEQMEKYWLCHYFPVMMKNSIEKMSSFLEIKQLLEDSGFKSIRCVPFFITDKLQDFFLNAGKYRPEIYLDINVRNGISSFHLSADQTELNNGLIKLKSDIESGKIKDIIQEYESKLGDYLFIVSEK